MSDDRPQPPSEFDGKMLGQYQIRRQLGQGGMATVYLAYQPAIERTVAIKIMPRHFLHDPNFLERFQREVKVIARLQHPRIVPVFDYGQIDEQPYIVMAYMNAGTLADRMEQGPLPLDEVVRLVEQIAEGLDHAHGEGVIHRDFKPSNVLLDKGGNAHLADFGIAKISESTAALTGSSIVGTPAYMAPETANAGEVSPAVDIYALGVTLYQMLTGQHPFQADTPLRVMIAHIRDPLPDLRAVRPDLPPGVAAVIQTAMAKDPAGRYQTAGEMARALRTAAESAVSTSEATFIEAQPLGAQTGAQTAPATPYPYTTPVPAPAAKPSGCARPFLIGGGALAAVLSCAAIAAVAASLLEIGPFAADTTPTAEPGGTDGAPGGEAWQGSVVAAPDCSSGSVLQEVRAVGEFTVQFALCRPDAAFLYKLGQPATGILPREVFEQTGSAGMVNNPVGTGPFRFESWDNADAGSLTLARFDDYWGEPAQSATFIFDWDIQGDAQQLFFAGAGDALDDPYDYPAVEADSGLVLIRRPALNTYFIGIDRDAPPLDDVRVRQAIALAFDRAALAAFWGDETEVASHLTPCSIPNGCSGPDWYDRDLEASRQLLAEAGYPGGFDIDYYIFWQPSFVDEEIQAQLAEVGIALQFQQLSLDEFLQRGADGSLNGLFFSNAYASYPHPSVFLEGNLTREVQWYGEPYAEIYQPVEEALRATDPIAESQAYERVNRAIREQVPLIPLFHLQTGMAYRSGVQNAHASPLLMEHLHKLVPSGGDTFTLLMWAGPSGLYCADESDNTSLRVCAQIVESLMGYAEAGSRPEPRLATSCAADSAERVWTCQLRQGVRFHDGSTLDAGDVVTSFAAAWDASNPYHVGRTGEFNLFKTMFGLINE